MEISMMIYFRNYLIFQKKYDFEIKTMNSDENHLHMLISMKQSISISQIVKVLKQESIVYIWKKYKQLLKLYFWKEHTFLVRRIFCLQHWRSIVNYHTKIY